MQRTIEAPPTWPKTVYDSKGLRWRIQEVGPMTARQLFSSDGFTHVGEFNYRAIINAKALLYREYGANPVKRIRYVLRPITS